AWTLQLPPGISGKFSIRLSGTLALPPGGELKMPVVQVMGARRAQQWVAVAGRDLRAGDTRGLRPLAEPARELQAWPAQAERIRRRGAAWSAPASGWHLQVLSNLRANGSPAVQVALAEQALFVADGAHWRRQTTYWLYHEPGAELTIRMPAHARLMSAFVDEA